MGSNYLQTFTQRHIDPFNAKDKDIAIEDIAHALSLICRWGGHTKKLYSVAEHSLLVAYLVYLETRSPHVTLGALLHDATEAYMQDLVSPIKKRLKAYCKAEKRLERIISNKFSCFLTLSEKKVVKRHDLEIRPYEKALSRGLLSSREAERNFLRVFNHLKSPNVYIPGRTLEVLRSNVIFN